MVKIAGFCTLHIPHFMPSQVRLTDSIESRSLNLNNLYQHNIIFKSILDDATSSEAFLKDYYYLILELVSV